MYKLTGTLLSEEEINFMGISEIVENESYNVGDVVQIKFGALKGQYATIKEVNSEKKRIKGMVNMMGESIIELDFSQISHID